MYHIRTSYAVLTHKGDAPIRKTMILSDKGKLIRPLRKEFKENVEYQLDYLTAYVIINKPIM
jgi:hypothetical protein